MVGRVNESKYRSSVICVDSYDDKVMKGRIYNPYLEGEIAFSSTMSLILYMEELLEEMSFPQAYEIKRSFGQFKTYIYQTGQVLSNYKGKKATFEIKILFRQNASWQGTVLWIEEEKEESFRSVLELMLLMNSALIES